ncbi:MAG: NTP transferase domain-containing protein [Desulfobacterales bacterium]|nr:NTP transferase domain-containing protein [Desulfobacterales bacterium]
MDKNIPVVILCGGFGTRLREETEFKPKPMVEIGGKPILWHIMKHYAHFGFRRFILCLGYKGSVIDLCGGCRVTGIPTATHSHLTQNSTRKTISYDVPPFAPTTAFKLLAFFERWHHNIR